MRKALLILCLLLASCLSVYGFGDSQVEIDCKDKWIVDHDYEVQVFFNSSTTAREWNVQIIDGDGLSFTPDSEILSAGNVKAWSVRVPSVEPGSYIVKVSVYDGKEDHVATRTVQVRNSFWRWVMLHFAQIIDWMKT
jgi:hypothetical protein